MNKIIIIETDDKEIDDLLRKHYGFGYEIVAGEELSNGAKLQITAESKELSEYDQRKFDNLKNGKFEHWATDILMNKLCIDGHIEAGDYLIDCSW